MYLHRLTAAVCSVFALASTTASLALSDLSSTLKDVDFASLSPTAHAQLLDIVGKFANYSDCQLAVRSLSNLSIMIHMLTPESTSAPCYRSSCPRNLRPLNRPTILLFPIGLYNKPSSFLHVVSMSRPLGTFPTSSKYLN